jgi:hypothetical protein
MLCHFEMLKLVRDDEDFFCNAFEIKSITFLYARFFYLGVTESCLLNDNDDDYSDDDDEADEMSIDT